MKVPVDYLKKHKEMCEAMGMDCDCEPVDMYGHRINLEKGDSSNLESTGKAIQEDYGLESY